MFNWDEERQKHKELINSKLKDEMAEDFCETMLDIFCKVYSLDKTDAILQWREKKDDFISRIKQ